MLKILLGGSTLLKSDSTYIFLTNQHTIEPLYLQMCPVSRLNQPQIQLIWLKNIGVKLYLLNTERPMFLLLTRNNY